MGFRMVGEKVGFVAGRACEPPVVHPGFQTDFFGNGQDFPHFFLVAVPIGMGEHVDNQIHAVAHHVAHILAGVVGHAVAVIGGTEDKGFAFHSSDPPLR